MNPRYYERLFKDPKGHYFLFGPRGTGKSTWLRRRYPESEALWIDLLDPTTLRPLRARPERIREIVKGSPSKKAVVIDEIQHVPEMLTVVHSLIEEKGKQQFILTGSSMRKLKRVGIDLLAGRALVKQLHPFLATEMGAHFQLAQAMHLGMLPVVRDSASPEETLASYVAIYLKEEVQAEGLVRNVGSFERFLEAISFSHGSILNVSNVARECEMERKTVEGYLSILEDLLLSFQLPVFTRRAKRKTSRHPKFYFFDPGVWRSIRPTGPLDQVEELNGGALEGLVAQQLRAWISYSGSQCKLSFWRTRKGVEVDFIVYGPKTFIAIEVKHKSRLHTRDVQPLLSFIDEYPEATPVLLYLGNERLELKDVLCLPCEEFLLGMHPGRDLLDVG